MQASLDTISEDVSDARHPAHLSRIGVSPGIYIRRAVWSGLVRVDDDKTFFGLARIPFHRLGISVQSDPSLEV